MHRYPNRGNIRPKISTMPRQQSESAAMLDLYKLVVEKKRLQQELQNLELRRQQIGDRLTLLNQQIDHLEGAIDHLRETDTASPALPPSPTPVPPQARSEDFNTLYLEY